jgi:hypothetical protein
MSVPLTTYHNKNKFSVATNNPAIASSPPHFPTIAIANTGCTGHYLSTDIAHINSTPANPGISVTLPDGSTIVSSHVTELNIPDLPLEARIAHIFPNLSSGSLISIGQLCDHCCTATFTSNMVTISLANKVILCGN